MRKWPVFLIALLLIIMLGLPAGGSTPTVIVDGTRLSLDVPPRIEQGTTMVPLRGVFEALGASVTWNSYNQTIIARNGDYEALLIVGHPVAFKNGAPVDLPVPASIQDGRTLVPLRFVSEALGAEVHWDSTSQTINITSNNRKIIDNSLETIANNIDREFVWSFGGKKWTYQMQIPQEAYDYYTGLKRIPTNDYSVYVTDPVDDVFISRIAAKFMEVVKQEGYSPNQTVEFVVSFVQNLKYISDNASKGYDQYARYPLETLVEQNGDCEDTSILLASILKEMNFGVVLVMLPGDPAIWRGS
ncbi:hypothetical protein N752_06675 [Desulforamulus aquiferis]|nr:copper amine oxidase N-terminal domain-containing protein [Desulforamulus aquiferis]RYD05923.1 hypothetical protein N752_06675 [Desulforamulus aquiferis]